LDMQHRKDDPTWHFVLRLLRAAFGTQRRFAAVQKVVRY